MIPSIVLYDVVDIVLSICVHSWGTEDSANELKKLRLPGELGEYTGNVMYPDEYSAQREVDG